ncbi:hypothetical protein, partial [Escherichia coli]|uniref:hypothetical protein n=1 Tax=Escherichia coli TaxID=562 RepID=UPI0022AC033D
WKGWAILLRQKQKKLIMLPSETMIWQPEFTDKTLSRKPGAVQIPAVKRRSLIPIPHKICRSFISSPLLFFVAMLTFPE